MAKATGAEHGRGARPPGGARGRRRSPPGRAALLRGVLWRIRGVCAGRTFSEIGKATGMDPETVRRQVRGLFNPRVEFVIALCLAYSISADWLLCGLGESGLRR